MSLNMPHFMSLNMPNFVTSLNMPHFVVSLNMPHFVMALNMPHFAMSLNMPHFVISLNMPYFVLSLNMPHFVMAVNMPQFGLAHTKYLIFSLVKDHRQILFLILSKFDENVDGLVISQQRDGGWGVGGDLPSMVGAKSLRGADNPLHSM